MKQLPWATIGPLIVGFTVCDAVLGVCLQDLHGTYPRVLLVGLAGHQLLIFRFPSDLMFDRSLASLSSINEASDSRHPSAYSLLSCAATTTSSFTEYHPWLL